MNGKDILQLLPGTKKRLGIKVPGENRFLYIGSAILGAVLVTSFSFSRYEDNLMNQLKNINQQISVVEQKRDMGNENNLKIVKQRLDVTATLLKDHIYWTQGIYRIASLIQKEVQLTSLSSSINSKQVAIKASATSYTVLARQIASFLADSAIKDVSLGEIGSSVDGKIEFDMVLEFDEKQLIKKDSTK